MEDHHVDRSAVEAPQGVELTDPNRSIELALLQERAVTMHVRPDKPLARIKLTRRTAVPGPIIIPASTTGWPKILWIQASRPPDRMAW